MRIELHATDGVTPARGPERANALLELKSQQSTLKNF
jgi:hypothetical protein